MSVFVIVLSTVHWLMNCWVCRFNTSDLRCGKKHVKLDCAILNLLKCYECIQYQVTVTDWSSHNAVSICFQGCYKKFNNHRGTAWRIMSVEILSTAAQPYEKSRLKRLAVVEQTSSTIRATFPEIWELERFQMAKVTFRVTQGHWCYCHSIGTYNVFLLVFCC